MTFMFELYYSSPEDKERESRIIAEVAAGGGRLDFHDPADREGGPVCLTFEFESEAQAELVAAALRERGEHVEGVCSYG